MLVNTSTHYGSVAKLLHWLMAIILIGLFMVAYQMTEMQPGEQKLALYGLHKATGVVMFALVIIRLTWRLTQQQPSLPLDMPLWQQRIAKSNYVLLYILMFGMPISGMTMSLLSGHAISFYNLFTIEPLAIEHPLGGIAHKIHGILSYVLIGAFAAHTGGALYHHFIRHDNVLKRMLPGEWS